MTARQADLAVTFGIRSPYEPDESYPPGDIFPTGARTPFFGMVIRDDVGEKRIERMEWGLPIQVPSKRDPGVKQTKYVTNVRNLTSSAWRSMLGTPARRCLVPVTAFSEYGQAPGEDNRKPLHWFDVPSRPIFAFAGIWRPTERGNAYGFLTTNPNAIVEPIHPKAMPVILHDRDYDRWLSAPWDEVKELVAPYPSQLMTLDRLASSWIVDPDPDIQRRKNGTPNRPSVHPGSEMLSSASNQAAHLAQRNRVPVGS